MAPDLGYYINQFGFAALAHTLVGSLYTALPTGLLFLLLFYWVRRPVAHVLPAPHRQALLPLCGPWPAGLKRWAIILVSLLLGVWTHIFWDAWTHDHGWFVQHIPALQLPLFRIGSNVILLPFVLQVLSTFVGFLILVVAYFRWLRRQPVEARGERESDGWRFLFWAGIAAAAVLSGVPLAIYSAGSREGYLLARAIMFRTAIFGADVGIPLGLIAAAIAYARRRQKT